jgi:hypothetical protein
MNPRLRTNLLNADHRLQDLFSLEDPVYTIDGNVLNGAGVYSAEEWARTRRLGAGDGGGEQYASDRTAEKPQKERV